MCSNFTVHFMCPAMNLFCFICTVDMSYLDAQEMRPIMIIQWMHSALTATSKIGFNVWIKLKIYRDQDQGCKGRVWENDSAFCFKHSCSAVVHWVGAFSCRTCVPHSTVGRCFVSLWLSRQNVVFVIWSCDAASQCRDFGFSSIAVKK